MVSHTDIEVSVFACTDIGMRRRGNEDAFMVADLSTGNWGLRSDMTTHHLGERGTLLVVSDGMGGAAAGEVASELAVRTLYSAMLRQPGEADDLAALAGATRQANENIYAAAEQNPAYHGMGATLTAALVRDTLATVVQVGDSRAYLIRRDRIRQLTRDQSVAQYLIDQGAITEEQAATFPHNVLLNALGTQPELKVEATQVQLCQGDCLLLCSDGLSNKVTADEMRHAVQNSASLPAACRLLVDLANERGGEDNITVVVAQFDGVGLHEMGNCPTLPLERRAA